MVCEHLKQLYHLCETNQLKLSSSDLIRVVCHQCNRHDVCPSDLVEMTDTDAESNDSHQNSVKPPQVTRETND
jgi:hypothetical protein